ncbi:hypothetical protein P3T43_003870 [Paraburkholderia sp. GAS41]|uniref:hypothetical protein n=1 Tax=Paraburkholderia sp. GAS41 TaxID=3035134 RepID=UPI003D1D940F
MLVKAGYLFILFLPTTFYHFVTEVAGRRGERRLVLASYGLCAVLAILSFTGDDLVAGFAMHDFGPYPKAGPWHPLHVLQTLFVACRSGWLLATAKREVGGKIRRRLLDRCLLGLYLSSLATVDYAVNYGAAFYPPDVVFIAAALGVLAVTIAQHGLTRPFLLAGAVARMRPPRRLLAPACLGANRHGASGTAARLPSCRTAALVSGRPVPGPTRAVDGSRSGAPASG